MATYVIHDYDRSQIHQLKAFKFFPYISYK